MATTALHCEVTSHASPSKQYYAQQMNGLFPGAVRGDPPPTHTHILLQHMVHTNQQGSTPHTPPPFQHGTTTTMTISHHCRFVMPTAAVVLMLFDVCIASQGSNGRGSPGPGVGLCDCVYPGDEHCLHLLCLFFSSLPRGSQPLPAWPCAHMYACA